MNYRAILSILGFLIFSTGLAMLLGIPFSLYYNDDDASHLLLSSVITVASGLFLWFAFKPGEAEKELRSKDGYFIVALGWLAISVFGTLPFLLSGVIPSFTDAFFETISGFTTTGASILTDVEKLPHGILFWRSLTHWIGGMGIIVMSLAIFPILGIGGMQLYRAEVAGPTKDKLAPRIAETARLLWGVYLLISFAEAVLLLFGGMSLFDALCHTFGTVATGGFSTKNASIGFYDSAFIDFVIAFFMFISATNFALHYAAFRGNIKAYFKNNEFVFYATVTAIAILVVTISTSPTLYHNDFVEGFRRSLFNVVSVVSCTGFATADFAIWTPVAQVVLFLLLFPGGCAGSTSGGIKQLRFMLLLKNATAEFKRLIHPQAVVPVRLDGRTVEPDILTTIATFATLYIATFAVSSIALSFLGLDLVSAMSAVASSMANFGPGLGSVGPMANYAHVPVIGKWVLSACMLLGRLELFTVLVIFSSAFWRK